MKNLEKWLQEYGESHQNPRNQVIHKVCVPAIVFSLLGVLWVLPQPQFISAVPFLNWATLLFLGASLFYLSLSWRAAFLVWAMVVPMLALIHFLALSERVPILPFFILIFVIAWVGQFWGHKIEGKKPSFLKDLAFLLIGPLWVLKDFLPHKRGER